jgi:hypothetical protein
VRNLENMGHKVGKYSFERHWRDKEKNIGHKKVAHAT